MDDATQRNKTITARPPSSDSRYTAHPVLKHLLLLIGTSDSNVNVNSYTSVESGVGAAVDDESSSTLSTSTTTSFVGSSGCS